jgi:hypothetical protein
MRSGGGQERAQTGKLRERNVRKQGVEACAAADRGAVVSWDQRWRTPPEMKARHREGERLRRERLDLDVLEAEEELAEAEERLANEQAKVARLNELIDQRSALLRQVDALQRERVAAELEARAVEKRLAYQQRRVERLGTRRDGPRRGRPVRVEVDGEAWAAVKREAVRRRVWLVWWLGDLVCVEVKALAAGEVAGTPGSRRRRSPGEGDPEPRRRFVRIDVDDDCWLALRSAAVEAGLSAGRYVGELVEIEAREVGWRAALSAEA